MNFRFGEQQSNKNFHQRKKHGFFQIASEYSDLNDWLHAVNGPLTESNEMRNNYDFSNGIKNPYSDRLNKPVTILLEEETISYFKDLADETGIPYQTLINLYLRDCASSGRRLDIHWKPEN
jgi:predicted DNA binding CopG/RHH family protein